MKEIVIPPAPPPPTINPIYSTNDGSGEAPMDMDTKDDEMPPAPPAPTISGSGETEKAFKDFIFKIDNNQRLLPKSVV